MTLRSGATSAGGRRSASRRDFAAPRAGTSAARMPPMLVGSVVLPFVVAFIAMRVLLSRFGHIALDRPNERSLHERPTPRSGGIGVLLGATVALFFGAI